MFRFLTAGESHGRGLSIIIEGVPAGLPLSEEYIARDLIRRQQGYGRGGRMQIEQDRAEVLSGVRHGLTLGSPIALLVWNKDWANWTEKMSIAPVEQPVEKVTRLRPGHADLAGTIKYSLDDVRPVLERASARETAARVAAGAVARRFLEEFGIAIHSHTIAIGGVEARFEEPIDWERVEASPVRSTDPQAEKRMMAAIDKAKELGTTVGGIFEVRAQGVPIGLGSHAQWDRKLDGLVGQMFLGLNAVKGVELGQGFAVAGLYGRDVHDIIEPAQPGERAWRHRTNRGGGIEGGMTNGEPVVVRAVVKPISTMTNPLPSVDLVTGEEVQAHYERSDICQVPPAGVIGEALLALVLAPAFLEKFGGDHIEETRRNYRAYLKTTGPRGTLEPQTAVEYDDD
ncbi:MAG: chorismate synthase [Dehalococcoidia bacterium]|nr:chorismate synthase [Dehalococcoidia bacterium]